MNFTGSIKVICNGDTKFFTSYKFNADMYYAAIMKFFNEHEKNKIKRMFADLKYIHSKQYSEMVKLAGLHDYYDFNEEYWKDQDGNKKFILMYPELDNRCFINLFSGSNDFETLMSSGRIYVLDNSNTFSNKLDFNYIINLDEWKMGINSLFYEDKVVDLPMK